MTDLWMRVPYEGKSDETSEIKRAWGGFYRVTVDEDTKTVLFEAEQYDCRDTLLFEFEHLLATFFDRHPNIVLKGDGGDWKATYCGANYSPVLSVAADKYFAAALGETNKGFSPFASPFLLRFYIGALKAFSGWVEDPYFDDETDEPIWDEPVYVDQNGNPKGWEFEKFDWDHSWMFPLLRKADEAGVRLNSDVRASWFFADSNHLNDLYDVFAWRDLEGEDSGHIVKAFPPAALIGGLA